MNSYWCIQSFLYSPSYTGATYLPFFTVSFVKVHRYTDVPNEVAVECVYIFIYTNTYIPVNGSYVPCAKESCYYKKYLKIIYSQGKIQSNVKIMSPLFNIKMHQQHLLIQILCIFSFCPLRWQVNTQQVHIISTRIQKSMIF